MHILCNRWFKRFIRKNKISTEDLLKAVEDIKNGRIDVDLGDGVIKQRIARPGRGKSAGYRTLMIYRRGDLVVFEYGFSKNEVENLQKNELEALKERAKLILGLSETDLATLIAEGELLKVPDDG